MRQKFIGQILILVIYSSGLAIYGQSETARGVGVRMKNEQTGNFETVALYQKSYALVIGESKYKFTSAWKELEGVRKDVPAITKLLKDQGFDEVIVAQDLTRAQLDQTIRGFISKYGLARENRLLIYYAGHGYTETTEDGLKLGYIVPIDAPSPVRQPDVFYETAMSMNDIESYALSIRSKHVLFVFDSCFSGTVLRKTRATVPPIITLKAAQPVRQFITSGAEDQEVPDVSQFRQQLEEGLRGEADLNNDGYITGSELGDFLQEKVTNYSRGSQTLLTGKIANGALDKGDFIFILKKAAAVQSAQNNSVIVRTTKKSGGTIRNGNFIVSYQEAGNNMIFVLESINDFTNNLGEDYPQGDFSSIDVDVNKNGLIDKYKDVGYGLSKNSVAICPYFWINGGAPTGCPTFKSKSSLVVEFKGTEYEQRSHPVYKYIIPKAELSDDEESADMMFTIFSGSGGLRFNSCTI